MRPERWREVERLYHAALERDPEGRAAFLAEASGGDEELLDEVRSLLEQNSGDSRLDRAVWEPGAEPPDTRFATGTQLGQYRIEAALGAGRDGRGFPRARHTSEPHGSHQDLQAALHRAIQERGAGGSRR